MKKFLLALMIFGVALFVVACNENDAAHEHTFSEEWSSDDFNHWHNATCEHTDQKADFAGHFWGEGEVTTEPTCKAKGVRTFTCSACGKTKTEDVKMLEHEWVCAVSEEDSTKHITSCKNCGEVKETVEHVYKEVVTAATCTTYGKTEYTCEGCGHSYVEEHTEEGYDASNHSEKWDMAEGKWPCCDVELYDPSVDKVMLDGHMNDAMWAKATNYIDFNKGDGSIEIRLYGTRNANGIYFYAVYKVKTLKAASQQWWTSDNWEIRVVNANGTLSNLKEVNVVQFWVATFTGYGGSNFTAHYVTPISDAVTDGDWKVLYFEVFASYEQLGITADEKYLGFTVGSAGGSGWYASENTHADQGIFWDRADIAQNFKITEEGLFVKLDPDTCEHLFSNPVVTNPSCSEDGNNAYTCRLCGHVKNEPIPSTGNHNFEEVVSTVPSTCTTVGTQVLGCTGCDEETEVDLDTVDYFNHDGEVVDGVYSCCGGKLVDRYDMGGCGSNLWHMVATNLSGDFTVKTVYTMETNGIVGNWWRGAFFGVEEVVTEGLGSPWIVRFDWWGWCDADGVAGVTSTEKLVNNWDHVNGNISGGDAARDINWTDATGHDISGAQFEAAMTKSVVEWTCTRTGTTIRHDVKITDANGNVYTYWAVGTGVAETKSVNVGIVSEFARVVVCSTTVTQ